MKHLIIILAVILLALAPDLAGAHDYTHGSLRIVHPWARFTPPGAPNGAVYMAIENQGTEADQLIGWSTPRAARAELHATRAKGEVMSMQQISLLRIDPKQTVTLQPSSLHLMLFKLTAPLKEGERFPFALKFANAGEITVEVVVQRGPEPASDGHHHE